MVARVKPEVAGVITGRVTHKTPNAEEVDADIGKRRQRGDLNDGFGHPMVVKSMGGCIISYRAKPAQGGEHRRYHIGYVQFAFVRHEGSSYIVHLTGQDDAPSGVRFSSEAAVNDYLMEQLQAK